MDKTNIHEEQMLHRILNYIERITDNEEDTEEHRTVHAGDAGRLDAHLGDAYQRGTLI